MQPFQSIPITKSRNLDDYVDDVRVRRDRNSSISSSSVDFSVLSDFHPDFLPLMTKFMEFLICQPEYNRIVHGSSNFSMNSSSNLTNCDNSSEIDSNPSQNGYPDSIEPRTCHKTDFSAKNSIGSKIESNKRSFSEVSNQQRLSNRKEEVIFSLSTEPSNSAVSLSEHQKKKVTFSADADNPIDNPKIKAVSLGEISVSPDKRDQNGLKDFISEISTSISGMNAALGDIIRRIDRLEKTNTILKIQSANKEILPENGSQLRKFTKRKRKKPESDQNQQKQSDRIPRHPKINTTADPSSTDNSNGKSPEKIMKPDNSEDKSIKSNHKQSKKRKLQNEKSIEDNIDSDERHSNIAENLGNRSGQFSSNYPGEEKYLVDCLSSLSGELTKHLNFLLKYSKIYPEQFLLPIYLTNCENQNDLNFNLNFINSNILIFLTELSCNSPSEKNKLFREIHLLSIFDRKSFHFSKY